jgi:hypothetical protein
MNTCFNKLLYALGFFVAAFSLANAATLELSDPQTMTADAASFPVRLGGSNGVVAMQFDVTFPAAQASFSAPALKAVVDKHQVTYREVSAGMLRVVVYSGSNAALPQDLILDLPVTLNAGTPAEGPVVTLRNIWFADPQGRMIPASASYGPVSRWKRLTFTLAELNDPLISGDLADPENDALPNLVEMLLRGRAKLPDPTRLPVIAPFTDPGDGKQYLTLTYRQWKLAQGVTGEVQASTDMVTWPTVVPAVPTGVQDAETVEMRAAVEVTGQPQMFLRLRAKRAL